MRRLTTPRSSTRTSEVDLPLDDAWAVVASAARGPQWYVDAAPLVFRGTLDKLVGGPPQQPTPGRALLEVGDKAGFWRVDVAEHGLSAGGDGPRELLLTAEVRAPGIVDLLTRAESVPGTAGPRTRITQRIRLRPAGLLGVTYLVVDLPAREVVTELTHRRLLSDLARAGRTG